MSKDNVWVVNRNGRWAVERGGNGGIVSEHDTQEEALDAARPISQREKVELIWQGADGQIQGRDSHGNDPPEIPG